MSSGPGSTAGQWPPHPEREGSPQATVDEVASRVQMVIDAAERAADAIRSDAEQQAAGYLAEARRRADELTSRRVSQIAELTDELVDHAEAVREHSERMVASLERAIRSVHEDASTEAPDSAHPPEAAADPSSTRTVAESASVPSSTQERTGSPVRARVEAVPAGHAPAQDRDSIPADILLHATRLAIAGNDRTAVGRALQSEFGIANPDPVLAKVFDR